MTVNSSHIPSAEVLLEKPQYLLHRIDTASSRLVFLGTTRERLSALPFIDGRAPLSPQGRSFTIKIRDALDWLYSNEPEGQSDRFIFHVSFCGSTVLARACEVPDKSFSLKEPRVLLDLATIKAQRLGFFTDQELWSRLIRLALGQLRKPWASGEVVIVKPSNWANSILFDLLGHGLRPRAVLLSIGLRDFLIAVLRGGRDRVAYVCRLATHYRAEDPVIGELIDQAEAFPDDPMEPLTRLAALAWHAQIRIFDRALATKSAEYLHRLSYKELVQRPAAALNGVSRALHLGFSKQEIGSARDRTMILDAKNPDRRFDPIRVRQINQEIEKRHGPLIAGTVDWYQSVVGS